MLSRVACNLYWMGRQLERAENTARIISVHGNLLMDLPRGTTVFGWEPLITIISNDDYFQERYRVARELNVVKFLLADTENPSSIISALGQARENLRTTRDIIPREAWEALNGLYLTATERVSDGLSRRTRHEYLKRIIRGSQQISGLLAGTMSHGIAYHFLCLGHFLERADMTTRILDARAAGLLPEHDQGPTLSPVENIQWMSILKSLTAYQMYRQHVRLRVQGPDVLNFLLRDIDFPRAVGFCLFRIERGLGLLPPRSEPREQIKRLQQRLDMTDVSALVDGGLHQFIDELQTDLAELHNSLDRNYFNPQAVVDSQSALLS